MPPNDIFLSIAEFARAAGVSPQSIYPKLDKDLKEYCQLIDGRKSLHRDALKLYEIKPLDNDLTAVVRVLERQLEVKDNQIKELQEIIKASQQIEHEKNQLLLLEVQPVEVNQEPEAPPATVKSPRWFNWFKKNKGVD